METIRLPKHVELQGPHIGEYPEAAVTSPSFCLTTRVTRASPEHRPLVIHSPACISDHTTTAHGPLGEESL